MSEDSRSLKDEIESETQRLFQEFLPYLENEIEKAKETYTSSLLLCLTSQDRQPDYFPVEQASKSFVSEIISVLEADAKVSGLILPYCYESLAIICRGKERDAFAETIEAASKVIAKHPFGRTLPPKFISMSFGLSSYPFDSLLANELVSKAGLALEAAELAGGNTVRCFWRRH